MKREILDDAKIILTRIRNFNKNCRRTVYLALLYLHMINNYGQSKTKLSEIITLVQDERLRERLPYIVSEQLWQAVRIKLNSINSNNIAEYWNVPAIINHGFMFEREAADKAYYSIFEKAANCVNGDSVLTNLMLLPNFIDKTSSKDVVMICAEENSSDYNYTRFLLEQAFNNYRVKISPIAESAFQTFDKEFDKIILNFRYRLKIIPAKEYHSDISNDILEAMGKLNKSNPNSRLGAIVEKEYLFNENNKDFISYLIEKELLEKILILRQYRAASGISNCYMLVIAGKRLKSKEVEFADLTAIIPGKYAEKAFDPQLSSDIERTYSAQEYFADYATIKKYNYDINPYHYLSIHTEGVKLKDFIVKAERGRVLSTDKLQECKSDITTRFKYLKQSDLCDGIIAENLTSLEYIPDNMRAYTLKENSIILSKNIKRGFAAVVHNIGDKEIIAEQNLLVLEVDTEKIDPWFLAAYLNIEEYPKLKETTDKLSFSKIENIIVSIPKDKTTQETLGKNYLYKLHSLKQAYKKLDKAVKDIYEDNEWFNL